MENTYDNIDNLGEVSNVNTSEDDYEPEETYIIPNSVSMSAQTNNAHIQQTNLLESQQGNVFYSHYSSK